MKALSDPRLTNPFPPDVAVAIAQTCGGMAHFAGTGPGGRTCRQCESWCRGAKKFRRDKVSEGGGLHPRRCRSFSRLMQGLDGAGVPHDARACRHFVEASAPPPVVAPTLARGGDA